MVRPRGALPRDGVTATRDAVTRVESVRATVHDVRTCDGVDVGVSLWRTLYTFYGKSLIKDTGWRQNEFNVQG